MPWHIGTSDDCPTGKPHAVVKDADGAVEGCHETEEQAQAQVAALYAGEEKAMDDLQTKAEWTAAYVNGLPDASFLHVESGGEKDDEGKTAPRSLRHLPYKDAQGAVDLPHLRNAISRLGQSETGTGADGWLTAALRKRLLASARRVLADEQKAASLDESRLVERIVDAIKGLFGREELPAQAPSEPAFMHWKEADGTTHWIARYSNNIRDVDNPPEIISSDSHRRFVELVDTKAVDPPELWLWHVPEWSLGRATWVAYDDSGFALAGGIVDEKGVPILEHLAGLPPEDVRVSHGMPSASIQRDGDDPTIITQHTTREISPLPTRWAANKGTGFAILKENKMSIPTEKRQALIEQWGLTEEQLSALEAANAETAQAAKDAGLESKEAAVVEGKEVSDAKEQGPTEAETPEAPVEVLTRQEVADAIVTVTTPLAEAVVGLQAQLAELTKEISTLKESDAEKIAAKAADTPAASLLDLIRNRAIGSEDARVDGRTTLVQSKPKETEPETKKATGIPFLDGMLGGNSQLIQ